LIALFEGQLKAIESWLAARPNFQVLQLDHADFITDAAQQAKSINAFLGGALDELAMVKAVDPSLHRNKS
jgi:predicted HicB family RNase H-like nuclease